LTQFKNIDEELDFLESNYFPKYILENLINSVDDFSHLDLESKIFNDYKHIESEISNNEKHKIKRNIYELLFYMHEEANFSNSSVRLTNPVVSNLIKLIRVELYQYIGISPVEVFNIIIDLQLEDNYFLQDIVTKCIENNPRNIACLKKLYYDKYILAWDYVEDDLFISKILNCSKNEETKFIPYLHLFKNKISLIQEWLINRILNKQYPIISSILEKEQWEFIKMKVL